MPLQPMAATDCEEATKAIEEISNDPMSGSFVGEAVECYLRKHVKNCSKCMEATVEGNMP